MDTESSGMEPPSGPDPHPTSEPGAPVRGPDRHGSGPSRAPRHRQMSGSSDASESSGFRIRARSLPLTWV